MPIEEMQERLWTAKEVARYLGLSPEYGHVTVGRWAAAGLIKSCRLGGRGVRFRWRDIQDHMERKKGRR